MVTRRCAPDTRMRAPPPTPPALCSSWLEHTWAQARELVREVYGPQEGGWPEHGDHGGHDEGDTDSGSEGDRCAGIMPMHMGLDASHALLGRSSSLMRRAAAQ